MIHFDGSLLLLNETRIEMDGKHAILYDTQVYPWRPCTPPLRTLVIVTGCNSNSPSFIAPTSAQVSGVVSRPAPVHKGYDIVITTTCIRLMAHHPIGSADPSRYVVKFNISGLILDLKYITMDFLTIDAEKDGAQWIVGAPLSAFSPIAIETFAKRQPVCIVSTFHGLLKNNDGSKKVLLFYPLRLETITSLGKWMPFEPQTPLKSVLYSTQLADMACIAMKTPVITGAPSHPTTSWSHLPATIPVSSTSSITASLPSSPIAEGSTNSRKRRGALVGDDSGKRIKLGSSLGEEEAGAEGET